MALTMTDSDWRTGSLFKIEALNDNLAIWINVAILFSVYAVLTYSKRLAKVNEISRKFDTQPAKAEI